VLIDSVTKGRDIITCYQGDDGGWKGGHKNIVNIVQAVNDMSY
jgi:hypothetical protein